MKLPEHILELNPELRQVPASMVKVKERTPAQPDLPPGFDSLLEFDFSLELTARGYRFILHPFTLYLPGMVCYTPDFIAWHERIDSNHQVWRGKPIVYEIKGEHVKNTRDSYTRFRIAAGLHPYANWVWVTRSAAGKWKEKIYHADR